MSNKFKVGDMWMWTRNSAEHPNEPDEINSINKKTMLELFEKTAKRSQEIRDAGYNLVSIWESHWKKLKKQNKVS
jgi:hypothetical protein